jgi:hypothetical protein
LTNSHLVRINTHHFDKIIKLTATHFITLHVYDVPLLDGLWRQKRFAVRAPHTRTGKLLSFASVFQSRWWQNACVDFLEFGAHRNSKFIYNVRTIVVCRIYHPHYVLLAFVSRNRRKLDHVAFALLRSTFIGSLIRRDRAEFQRQFCRTSRSQNRQIWILQCTPLRSEIVGDRHPFTVLLEERLIGRLVHTVETIHSLVVGRIGWRVDEIQSIQPFSQREGVKSRIKSIGIDHLNDWHRHRERLVRNVNVDVGLPAQHRRLE